MIKLKNKSIVAVVELVGLLLLSNVFPRVEVVIGFVVVWVVVLFVLLFRSGCFREGVFFMMILSFRLQICRLLPCDHLFGCFLCNFVVWNIFQVLINPFVLDTVTGGLLFGLLSGLLQAIQLILGFSIAQRVLVVLDWLSDRGYEIFFYLVWNWEVIWELIDDFVVWRFLGFFRSAKNGGLKNSVLFRGISGWI